MNTTPLNPCAAGPNCTIVWQEFTEGNVDDANDHGGRVSCDKNKDIEWDNTGKIVTIKYRGKNSHDMSKTCYVRTFSGFLANNPNTSDLITHGYIESTIEVSSVNPPSADNAIWPAFWLVADSSIINWPNGGEIDIAERQYSHTETHLIGDPDAPFGPNMVTFARNPSGFPPGAGPKKYGMEWLFENVGQPTATLTLTIYFEDKAIGQYSFLGDNSNIGLKNVYTGLSSGWMEIVFDADSHGEGGEYSITVSDVTVYSVN